MQIIINSLKLFTVKQSTLVLFKKDVRRFAEAYNPVAQIFTNHGAYSHELSIVSVLLQNLGFDGSMCAGYSIEQENKKCQELLSTLESLAEYYTNTYAIKWAYDEMSMLWMGYDMSEYDEYIESIHDEVFGGYYYKDYKGIFD